MITQERLQEKLHYEPTTGVFTRELKSGRKKEVGYLQQNGYTSMGIDGTLYKAHRLAWLYVMGEFPAKELQIDHINHDKADNRIKNLRVVTRSENMRNAGMYKDNTSGYNGVCWRKLANKWQASIRVDGVQKHLGLFTNKEDAIAAREEANIKYNFHTNHGV